MSTQSTQQEYIQSLVQNEIKLSLEDFFTDIHERFYFTQDISFMKYFLELTEHEGEFYVHHEKLVEYGVMTSKQSWAVKVKLDALGLVEDEDFSLLQDVLEQWNGSRGIKHINVYMLTPEAFKTCLMRAQRRSTQTVDPVIYSKYYLLLEKTYKLYIDYEKHLLNKQLEQNQQELQRRTLELEEERQYRLDLQDSLIDNSRELDKTQIVYIATSKNYARRNRFKVGGVESEDKLGSRLYTYNTRSANGDDFFYTNRYFVHNYKEIENRLKDLVGNFRDRKNKEIYILHYSHLTYIVEYLIDHYNDEVDEINKKLEDFIKVLNIRQLKPIDVKPLNIAYIQQTGHPDVTLVADSADSLTLKMEIYIKSLNSNTMTVKAKDVFDSIGLKTGRRDKYSVLMDIISKILPSARMVKF